MRPKNTVIAAKIGKQLAEQYYTEFCDKTNQGPNWKWENFPEFVWKFAKVHCFTAFHHHAKNMRELEVICADAAKLESIELMKTGKHL